MPIAKYMPWCYMMPMSKREPTKMQDDGLSQRVIIPMSPGMIEAIQEYRFMHRLESRAEAVRQLIEIGLETTKSRKPKK